MLLLYDWYPVVKEMSPTDSDTSVHQWFPVENTLFALGASRYNAATAMLLLADGRG